MYMDAQEAADYLGISRQTLYAYVSRGLLDSIETGDDGRRRQYRKSDLDRLRHRSDAASGTGPRAGDALRWGRPSLDTDVSDIGHRGPIYRKTALRELVRDGTSFDAAASMLWTDGGDDWPIRPDDLTPRHTDDPPTVTPDDPLDTLRIAAVDEAVAEPAPETQSRTLRTVWRRLITRTARYWFSNVPNLSREVCRGDNPIRPAQLVSALALDDISAARNSEVTDLIDTTMLIVAEHGMNASTFTGRISASAGASLVDGVTASLATFNGDAHGRHCQTVRQLVDDLRRTDDSPHQFLTSRIQQHASLPGFGHPLYEHGDPRYGLLRDAIDRKTADSPTLDAYDTLTRTASECGLAPPNLDVGLSLIADLLELSPGHASFVFAAGRLAGWLAHLLEQLERDELLRPRAR